MKTNNKINKSSFFDTLLIFPVNLAAFFRFVFFTPINGLSIRQSSLFFWILCIVLWLTGTFIAYNKRRSFLSVALISILPLEIYYIIANIRYLPVLYTAGLSAVILLSAAYLAFIAWVNKKDKKITASSMRRYISFAIPGICNIFAVVFLCVMIPACANSLLGYGLMTSDNDVNISVTDDTWTIANNIETVARLDPETWQTLSLEEKMDVLETVKKIEMRYLGITDTELYLDTKKLDSNVLGTYNSFEKKITIDIEHLKNSPSDKVLGTLLHECKHLHDRLCVEAYAQIDDEYKSLLLFRKLGKYREEFFSDINAEDDLIAYYTQAIEISARSYSEEGVPEYFEYINEYLNKDNTEV